MKRSLILLSIAALCISAPACSKPAVSLADKVNKHETEIKNLKKENESIKKTVADIKKDEKKAKTTHGFEDKTI
jgi:peptidoglycan hydrolase CwlO-like protein